MKLDFELAAASLEAAIEHDWLKGFSIHGLRGTEHAIDARLVHDTAHINGRQYSTKVSGAWLPEQSQLMEPLL